VAYSFGRRLIRSLGVPVGLINASWGGTCAETWATPESLQSDPDLRPVAPRKTPPAGGDRGRAPGLRREVQGLREPHPARRQSRLAAGLGRAGADRVRVGDDGSARATGRKPATSSAACCGSGATWTCRLVGRQAAYAFRRACDKSDVTYFNNAEVGSLRYEDRADAWSIPARTRCRGVSCGPASTRSRVRVVSHMYGGGMTGPAGDMRLAPADGSGGAPIPLAGPWRCRVEQDFWGMAPQPPEPLPATSTPPAPCSTAWSRRCYPTPSAARSGTRANRTSGAPRSTASCYRPSSAAGAAPGAATSLLHRAARELQRARPRPGESHWAELREAQATALSVPGTGLAVTIDIGDTFDIHPRNKQEVGRRLALQALAGAYGRRDQPACGPSCGR